MSFLLPHPTGLHRVGTQIRHFQSDSRLDPFSGDQRRRLRELMLQIWYPADQKARGKRQRYLSLAATTVRTARLALLPTDAIANAPFSPYRSHCPVLIFVPSWRGQRGECTALAQELASHGYVVIGIDHPSLSRRTVFPDGRAVSALDLPGEDYSSEASLAAFVAAAEQQVAVRTADVREILDALVRWSQDDPESLLTGHIDLTHPGIFGFSIGGSTACEACCVDPRLRAGMNLGGMIAGNARLTGPQKPFFYLFEDDPALDPANLRHPDPRKRRAAIFGSSQVSLMQGFLSQNGGYWLRIPGTKHRDLCDALFLGLRSHFRNSLSTRKRVFEIIRSATVGFFNQQLDTASSATLRNFAKNFPEVQFKEYPPPQGRPAPQI